MKPKNIHLSSLNTQTVTKDYFDHKLSDLRGDLIQHLRKEDTKLGTLVNKLGIRKVLPTADVNDVLTMEPFPKTF